LQIFGQGAKTELILNILIFTDFARWEQKTIKEFITMIKEIISSGHELNRILLCYNPILAIALSCEFLMKIASSKFSNNL
jgi:hypothetical protein